MPAPDLSDRIEQAAADPAAAAVDGQSVTDRPIGDLIEAQKFLDARAVGRATNENGGPVSGWAATAPAKVIFPGM